MKEGKNNKKRVAAIVAVLCLALVGGLALYAWLTAQSGLTNNFTTKGIYNPTTDPDNPNDPIPTDPTKVDGNLTETKWVDGSNLSSASKIAKNPNVGLGKGSEDAYVYVYVRNDTLATNTAGGYKPYFVIDTTKWAAVEATKFGGTLIGGTENTVDKDNAYTEGLFVYTGGQTITTTGQGAILKASTSADVWTGELFKQIIVPSLNAQDPKKVFNENPTIKVNSFVYAVHYTDENKTSAATTGAGSAANALTEAKEWVQDLKNGNTYINEEAEPTNTTSTTTSD